MIEGGAHHLDLRYTIVWLKLKQLTVTMCKHLMFVVHFPYSTDTFEPPKEDNLCTIAESILSSMCPLCGCSTVCALSNCTMACLD